MVISLAENYLRTIDIDRVVSLIDCGRGLFTVHCKDNLDTERTCKTTLYKNPSTLRVKNNKSTQAHTSNTNINDYFTLRLKG